MFSRGKKSKEEPALRVRQFADVQGNGLSVRDGKLWCSPCGTTVNHERKSSVKKHLDSATHKLRRGKFFGKILISFSLSF